MLHLSLVISVLVLWFTCLVSSLRNDRHNIRCADVERRVQCGFPGISKRKCLEDCNCCFDSEAGEEEVQCFFKAPPKRGGCCDVKPKKRRACRVKQTGEDELVDLELSENPYLCRRLGCCFDGTDRGESIPRCYTTKPDCCDKVKAEYRVDAALTKVNRQQCLRMPGTCFSRDKKPHCYYKYSSCKCQKHSSRPRRPCSRKPWFNNNPYMCLKAGCCFDRKNKCYKPDQHRRSVDLDSQTDDNGESSDENYAAEAADDEEEFGYEGQSSDFDERDESQVEDTAESQMAQDEDHSISTEADKQQTLTQVEPVQSIMLAENAPKPNDTQSDVNDKYTSVAA